MSNKPKSVKRFANFLIILGISLVAAFCAYEAVNYPWNPKTAPDELPTPAFPDSNDPAIIFEPYNGEAFAPDTGFASIPASAPIFTEKELPGTYTVLGAIKIPAIEVAENMIEGTGPTQLGAGVGHEPGTGLPGQAGNCVLAGHRLLMANHPFRYLDMLDVGDKVYFYFLGQEYVYEVYDSFVVDPSASWVMEKLREEKHALTLITCETVYNPVNRLILRARLVLE